MAWLMSVLGAVLAVAGAASLLNGISYIRLDWGATEVIAGTVALAGGLVTLALGAVLFALRDLARRTERAAAAPAGVGMEALTGRDEPLEDEARPSAPGRIRSKLAAVGLPKAERTVPVEVPVERPNPLGGPRDLDGAEAAARPRSAPRPEPPEERDGAGVAARDLPTLEPPQDATALTAAPTVVGRYEANGASYVLFSDGTIEVETEAGTHRFASMADLKAHIERQEAG